MLRGEKGVESPSAHVVTDLTRSYFIIWFLCSFGIVLPRLDDLSPCERRKVGPFHDGAGVNYKSPKKDLTTNEHKALVH